MKKGKKEPYKNFLPAEKYYEINLPHLFGNPLAIYPELRKDFAPSLMTDFSSNIDKNSCEVVAAFNLLRYYSERKNVKGLFDEGDYEKSFHLLDRKIHRLPLIGGQIGLGALIGTIKYLRENQLRIEKERTLIWPVTFYWVKRNIEMGRPIIIGLFNHKKYHHHAVLVLGAGESKNGRYYRIADGWNTGGGSTLEKFIPVSEVLADGWSLSF